MDRPELPIAIHRLAYLQAYLYQIFTLERECKNNFDNTRWFLKETHNLEEINSIIEYFKSLGLKCDCDIINKYDLREIAKKTVKHHQQNYK